jgi:hypothetical protein
VTVEHQQAFIPGTTEHFRRNDLRGGNKGAPPIISAGMILRPNRGVWSAEDIERLRLHIERGGSATRAACMFKRTEAAVKAKALELGLKFLTINQLRRRARGDLSPPVA